MNVKTGIDDIDILADIDSYAAVSWFEKSNLYFIEGYAAGQETFQIQRRRKRQ